MKSNLWFSLHDKTLHYKGDEPAFYDSHHFTWANDIAAQVEVIYQELQNYLKHHELPSHFSQSMVSKKDSWKPISLKTWSIEHFKNQALFPQTTQLISKYPEIISASFNLLSEESEIRPHCGDTNAIWRCHLGLEIPGQLPECGFKVLDQSVAWEKGKWVIFIDAHKHTAWNHTSGKRYIFLIDVIRPEFQHQKAKICATVMTSLFIQRRLLSLSFLNKMPFVFIRLLGYILAPFSRLGIWYVNKVKKY